MKLSICNIANALPYEYKYLNYGTADALKYVDALPYIPDNKETSPNILYIISWDQLKDYSGNMDAFICIGGTEDSVAFFQKHEYIGIIYEDLDFLSFFCKIRQVFNHFNQLELELLILLEQDAPTKKILDQCAEFFSANVSLYDSGMSLIESSSILYGNEENQPQTVYPKSIKSHTHDAAVSPISPQQSSNSLTYELDEPKPHYDFVSNNFRFATMVINYGTTPNAYSFSLIDFVGCLVKKRFEKRYFPQITSRDRMRSTIQLLLRQDSKDAILSNDDFNRNKWMENDIYRLVVIQFPANSQLSTFCLHKYENFFSEYNADYVVFSFDDNIVLVFHGDSCDLQENSISHLQQHLGLDDALCYISMKFCDYHNINIHYFFMLNASHFMPKEARLHFFKPTLLRYAIERTRSVLPLKALCHYAAIQVDRYDKENGTEFLLTLETYLANNKSLLEAANKLFVHKSTISYRLKCINQITSIDYNDPMERIDVLISCMILRAFNELNNS